MTSLIQVAMRRTFRPTFRLAITHSRAPFPRTTLIPRSMSSEGQIQQELMNSMKNKISAALNAEKVEVTDVQGDGRHVEIVVVSKEFEGKSAVNRQRLVYKVRTVYLAGHLVWIL